MLGKLISKIREYMPDADLELVEKAYYFAEEAHLGQMRNSGEPFFTHPCNVALILCDLNMDTTTIIAGLLHDVIEDTDISYDEIAEEFGDEIAYLVDGVTKLKNIPYQTKQESQAENLKKMVLAMAEDIRVIIVKLADRLHNMRTLAYMSEAKRKEKALETLEIYAPLAHRLGISKIKWELEDLSLRFLHTETYYQLVDLVAKKRGERERDINKISQILGNNLDEAGVEYDISGRPKSFYSIYKKMKNQDKEFEEIFDLTAIRVIVNTISECYEVLGIVHNLWNPIPGRFKDYVAMPKPNMYQSIHTTVIGERGEVFEVQIRTWEMHRTAEYGIAAHWKYKEGSSDENNFDEKLTWLRQLLEWQGDSKDPREFMETLKVDFFTDEVYVFTPRGDVINLPKGSTPIDFAYRVHTEVGNRCVGAKVDGRIVPLDFKLKTGNIVNVLTSENSGPSRDWINIVKSPQARTRIRQWFKVIEKDENIQKGIDLLEREVRKLKYNVDKFINEEKLEHIGKRMGLGSLDDLYASIGFGSTPLNQIIPKLREQYERDYKTQEVSQKDLEKDKSGPRKRTRSKKTEGQGINIEGIENIKVRFAGCCNPVPGDDIIGYITRGRGVSVHRKDCPNIIGAEDPERFMEVYWDTDDNASYPAEIQIQAINRPQLLAEITIRMSETDISLLSLNARTNRDGIALINMTLEIKDTEELEEFLKDMRRKDGIIDAYRVIV